MGGGPENRCVGRVYGLDGAVLLHLMPRLTMSGSVPPFPNALSAYTGTHFEKQV